MFVSNRAKSFLNIISVGLYVQTVFCQSDNKQEINYLKTKLNLLSDRVEQLEYKEAIYQKKIGNLSSRLTEIENQSQKNRAIIQEQQKRLELFEAQSNKIILDMSDCCLGIGTTAIPKL